MAVQFHRMHVVSSLLPQIPWKVSVFVIKEFKSIVIFLHSSYNASVMIKVQNHKAERMQGKKYSNLTGKIRYFVTESKHGLGILT